MHHALHDLGRGQPGGHLGARQVAHQVAVRHDVADPHRRADGLGVAAQVDHALRAVQRREQGGNGGHQLARNIVFHDPQAVALGRLQHAERVGHAQAGAAGVLQHRVDEQGARTVRQRGGVERLAVDAVDAARHADHAHAHQPQQLQQIGVAGLLDQHRIAGAQQGAHDQVQPVRDALRQQHLVGLGRHAGRAQAGGDGLAQRRVAIGMPIAGDAQRRHPAQVPQRLVQALLVQPFGRQPAAARLDRDGVVGIDIGQQPTVVEPRRRPLPRGACARRGRLRRGGPVARPGPGNQPALRGQTAIGAGHGKGADAVLARELAHRRHGHAGPQHLPGDGAAERLHDLLDQRRRLRAAAHGLEIDHGRPAR